MDSTLLTGPKHADLERKAFEKAANIADDSLGSVLLIARNDARRSEAKGRWAEAHKPLCLHAETMMRSFESGMKSSIHQFNPFPAN